jgi:hypothetical protein
MRAVAWRRRSARSGEVDAGRGGLKVKVGAERAGNGRDGGSGRAYGVARSRVTPR